jgi:hypothetical protein
VSIELDQLAGPDGGEEGQRLALFWRKQIDKIRDDSKHKRWLKRCTSIEKRYRDERNRTDEEGQRRCNVLWTNVEILTPAIYGKCPTPIAERRFRDKDPVGRGAAQILERSLRNEIEITGYDEALQQAVRDYLLVGRGVVWVRYEPEVEEGTSIVSEGGMDIDDAEGEIKPDDEDPEAEKLKDTGDRITRESTPIDYIHWEDFFTMPFNARTWKEVTAVAKRVYMTRDRMKDRFGPVIAKAVPLKKDERGAQRYDGPDQDPDDKGEVFEIWSLTDKSVYWVAEGYDYLCDRKDDPLDLENFFPCPRPIFSNTTNGTLIPVPDYIEYQDQAIQIDELTQRISMLAKACKVAGVYNAAAKDIMRLLDESVENELIPVDDWAAFADKGGVAGNISLLPLKEIIGCLNELVMIKEKTVVELDRLTGINDIMRGTTDPRETLGGQRLKSNTAGTRLQRRQNEVARFARDTVRIMADIMSQHFSPLSLIEASGALYEEGLGETDMPELSTLQGPPGQLPMLPQQAPFSGQPQAQGPVPPPVGAGPTPQMAAPPPPMGGPPAGPPGMQPPGTNIVPFPGQQAPAGQPMGGQPPVPPELQAKMQGLQRISDAITLLRNERLRGFRVDIEVDSTIYGDSQQEKGDRVQFITTVTQFLQQAMLMSGQVPQIAPLLGKFLQFGVRGFHVGRDLEAAIEDFSDSAVKLAHQKAQQASSQPQPAVIAAQAQMLKAHTVAQSEAAKSKREDAKLQLDAHQTQQKSAIEQQQAQAEIQRQAIETQGDQQQAQADIHMKGMDVQMREMEMRIAAMREQMEMMKMQRMQTENIQKAMAEPNEGVA